MRLFECALHGGGTAGRDDQRRIGARIANVRARKYLDLAWRDALAGDLGLCRLAKRCADAGYRRERLVTESEFNCLFTRGAYVGQAHTVGREQRREGVDEHARHAKCVGDQTCVLATRAAEAV